MTTKRFAVFLSGTGSLFQAVLDAGLTPVLVIADRPCRGLDIARERGIPAVLIRRPFKKSEFTDDKRDHFSKQVAGYCRIYKVDFVAMLGFFTVLSALFFHMFKGTIANSHPALLPLFPGANAVQDALDAGVHETGCTIHRATEIMDDHRYILRQKVVPIPPGISKDDLHELIKVEERLLWPEVIREELQLAA